jgi:hypothetical protein
MSVEVTVDVSDEEGFSETQHCTRSDDECYSFSHTYLYCGRPQPRFCECPFDYEAGWARAQNYVIAALLVSEVIRRGS